MPIRIMLAIVTLLSTVSVAEAEMYQWVDENGSATRSDRRAVKPAAQSVISKNERFTGTVEIYVTEWCGYCKKAQKYMKEKGIPYVAYDIEKDSAAMQRHKELGGRGVPLIVIGSKKMSGFSPESFEYFLNNSR